MNTPTSASVFDPDDYWEIVVELDSAIEPLDYAGFFLTQLDVPHDAQKQRVHFIYEYAIHGFSVYLTEAEFAKAERLGLMEVLNLTKSQEVSVSPITNVEGQMPTKSLDPDLQITPTGIQRAYAFPDGVDYSTVDVAVIDTGVDRFHPDLNVVGGVDCVDTAFDQTPDFGFDGYGHGTHVAGTIAAADNGIGVVGVAPGARIWSVKVLDSSGRGSYASVICGLDWVAENTATIEVANMSLGGQGFPSECGGDDPMHNAVCVVTEQTIVVVSAGNSSSDSANSSPANYDEVVTVSAYADFDGQRGGGGVAPQDGCYAMSTDDFMASFSNFGPAVDISAPGTCILSTVPGVMAANGYAAQYGLASGTSMAAPHVAGCIARYLSSNPDQTEYAVQQVLSWSDAKGGLVKGDRDYGFHEPLLYCNQVPRYQGSSSDYVPPPYGG